MRDHFFASNDVPPGGASPSKRRARPKADTKSKGGSLTKELLREEQSVLKHFKKALAQMHKAQQLADEFLPKIETHAVAIKRLEQSPETPNASDKLDAKNLRQRFDSLVKEFTTEENRLITCLKAVHEAIHKMASITQTNDEAISSTGPICIHHGKHSDSDIHPDRASENARGASIATIVSAAQSLSQTNLTFPENKILCDNTLPNQSAVRIDTGQIPSAGITSAALKHDYAESSTQQTFSEAISTSSPDAPLLSVLPAEANRLQPEWLVPSLETQAVALKAKLADAMQASSSAAKHSVDTLLKSPVGLLSLLSIRGVGLQSAEKLISRYSSILELQETPSYMLKGLVNANIAVSLKDKEQWRHAFHEAQQITKEAEKHNSHIVTAWDDEYPSYLKEISDRPLLLYVKGKLKPKCRAVACIGTREPSKFGYEVTRRITSTMVSHGWAIISGLALGVDSLAHEAALAGGGYTVAILGNGLDTIYPRKNAGLAKDILASGGALISEQPFGAPPAGHNLVQRDRLQSGMSLGTIVMQTDIVGGSMHTVRYTLTQGRLLFAPVPSGTHRTEPKSQGLLALTENNGQTFSKIVNATGAYAALLQSKFAERPPAIPLISRENYDDLLTQLEQVFQKTIIS